MCSKVFQIALLFWFFDLVAGGPAAYAVCQTGCNAVAVACYISAGVTFGVGSVPLCNAALGTCMAACVAAGLAPTP